MQEEKREETDLVDQLSGAFRRLAQIRHCLPMGGLPMGEFWMLKLIRAQQVSPDRGVYVSQLTKCTHASPPAVSRTLRKLEEKGLAKRETDPQDRRTTYVVLTQAGGDLLDASQRQMEELARRVVARMGSDALRTLTAQMDQLTQAVLEERQTMSVE